MPAVKLVEGECVEAMRAMAPASVDAVVTDPPYGIEFMGKEWDAPEADARKQRAGRRKRGGNPVDAPDPVRHRDVARDTQAWHERWAREALRVLKPGGFLLAFGGTRTYHRLACAVEDAGFEIHDRIWTPGGYEVAGDLAWMYGTGFPKSKDVSKAIDKAAGAEREVVGPDPNHRSRVHSEAVYDGGQSRPEFLTAPSTEDAIRWQGWGTALKPAREPICVARKPLVGTVAANVLEHGTGALNIDACRIEGVPPSVPQPLYAGSNNNRAADGRNGTMSDPHSAGRWPANVTLSEEAARELDERSGERIAAPRGPHRGALGYHGADGYDDPEGVRGYTDSGGASRFFYCAKTSRAERNAGLDGFAEVARGVGQDRPSGSFQERLQPGKRDAPVARNHHPTVKPLALMRWLVRLVTPPDGLILDPFLGSGSTGCAAVLEGFRFVGIERDPEYVRIAEARIRHWDPE